MLSVRNLSDKQRKCKTKIILLKKRRHKENSLGVCIICKPMLSAMFQNLANTKCRLLSNPI